MQAQLLVDWLITYEYNYTYKHPIDVALQTIDDVVLMADRTMAD